MRFPSLRIPRGHIEFAYLRRASLVLPLVAEEIASAKVAEKNIAMLFPQGACYSRKAPPGLSNVTFGKRESDIRVESQDHWPGGTIPGILYAKALPVRSSTRLQPVVSRVDSVLTSTSFIFSQA